MTRRIRAQCLIRNLLSPSRMTEMGMNRGARAWLSSWLLAVLAFNLVFILQDFFLVLPKVLVPGLHPILFHNNHDWSGSDPIAELLQGTGALAIPLFGPAPAATLRRRRGPGG